MKIIALAIAIIAACAAPQANRAELFVHALEPDAHCDAYYTGAGPQQTHAAVCRIPATKAVLYCRVTADGWPECHALNGDAPPRHEVSRAPSPPPTAEGPGAPPTAEPKK